MSPTISSPDLKLYCASIHHEGLDGEVDPDGGQRLVVEGVVYVPPHKGGLARGLKRANDKDHILNELTYCISNEDNFEDEVKPKVE